MGLKMVPLKKKIAAKKLNFYLLEPSGVCKTS